MILQLDNEERDSLSDRNYMLSSAIIKLLKHYNPNIEIHDEVSTTEALTNNIRQIQSDNVNDTHLLVLNVNALDKGFANGTNHYVGLMINKNTNSVLYVDPMGHEMSNEVSEIVNTSFQGFDISPYNGRLQYVDIQREGEVSLFIGNDTDCGPMLTYLLTNAAHGHELPTSQTKEESENIGRRLRFQFRQEEGKESHSHQTSNNISIDLSALQPNNLIIPEAPKRRLDSIARLINGEDICTAVIFDGSSIRIANNNNHESELISKNITLLSKVAKRGYTLQDISSDHNLQQERNSLVEEVATKIRKQLDKKSNFNHNKKRKMVQEHEERNIIDLTKVICSLAEDSDLTKRFPDAFKEALVNGKVLFIRSNKVAERGKHAEMTILDNIIENRKIVVPDKEISSGKKSLYMGITKLCCLNCHDAITAFNEVSNSYKIKECNINPIETRGTHLGYYDGWIQPNFVKNDFDVLQKFNEIQESRTALLDKTKESAPRSPSPPETKRNADTEMIAEEDVQRIKQIRQDSTIQETQEESQKTSSSRMQNRTGSGQMNSPGGRGPRGKWQGR